MNERYFRRTRRHTSRRREYRCTSPGGTFVSCEPVDHTHISGVFRALTLNIWCESLGIAGLLAQDARGSKDGDEVMDVVQEDGVGRSESARFAGVASQPTREACEGA